MSIHVPNDTLLRFIGTFYRVNSLRPPPRPTLALPTDLRRLVVTKGLLQANLGSSMFDICIPPDDQVDTDGYQAFTGLLSKELTDMLQIPELRTPVSQALNADGLIVDAESEPVRVRPLTAGIGELDQF